MDELDSLLAQFVSHRLGKVSCQNLVVVVGGDGRVHSSISHGHPLQLDQVSSA